MAKTVKVGDKAPHFTSKDKDGNDFEYKGEMAVIFFYPKDETAVCTKEACAFRDSYQDFSDKGVKVIGISGDSEESHQKFSAHHNLPYTLLSDTDSSLRKAFGVPKAMGLLPGRVTFVIDKEGIIRLVFSAMLESNKHVKKALDVIAEFE
ncbi:Peroxiredoxin [Carpediemonas membranifera]|uniref:thioredoxin-dependent peroxiredoxin n=1 Tax=Carpediemonas membranifera TaxID=201153 RepID=A0A8J6EAC2_9EUKA|nr:Peroxiredoxin [Carpediemonas membranifera]|eukprot:KAG9394495.1 Peroxiredoxin [Carpediemonas membranifera]